MKHHLALFLCLAAFAAEHPLGGYGLETAALSSFRVVKDQKIGGARTQHTIELEGPAREKVEIRILGPMDAAAARTLIETERTTLAKLYEAPKTPYMGDIAEAVGGCRPSMGPKNVELKFLGRTVPALLGAATAERAFGACSREEAKYKGAFWAYFDEDSRTLWTWRAFMPWKDSTKLTSQWPAPLAGRFKK